MRVTQEKAGGGSPVRSGCWGPGEAVESSTPPQLSVAGSIRSKVLALLSEGQASISELAGVLLVPKGTVAYHLRVLHDAGLVYVASTRQVRAVTERYYARVATASLIEPRPDAGDAAMDAVRQFLAENGGDLDRNAAVPAVRRLRLQLDRASEFVERLNSLVTEFADSEGDGSEAEPVGVIVGAYWLAGDCDVR